MFSYIVLFLDFSRTLPMEVKRVEFLNVHKMIRRLLRDLQVRSQLQFVLPARFYSLNKYF